MKKWISILMAFVLIFSMSAAAPEAESPVSSVSTEESMEETPSITLEPTLEPLPSIKPSPEPSLSPTPEISTAPPITIEPSPSAIPSPFPTPGVSPPPSTEPIVTPAPQPTAEPTPNTIDARQGDSYSLLEKPRSRAVGEKFLLDFSYICYGEGVLPFSWSAPDTSTFGSVAGQYDKVLISAETYKPKYTAYCIQHGLPTDAWDQYEWENFTVDQQNLIGDALYYGFAPNRYLESRDEVSKYAATQTVIWEITMDKFWDGNKKHLQSSKTDAHKILGYAPNASVARDTYDSIVNSIVTKNTIPSFAESTAANAPTVTLKWNGSKYTATLTDSNAVLDRYDFSLSGYTVSRSGNKLTISATKENLTAKTASASYSTGGGSKAAVIWKNSDPSRQQIATYQPGNSAKITAYIKIKTEQALYNVSLTKTSADVTLTNKNPNYSLAGAVYEVFNASGVLKATFTTDAGGKATLSSKLTPGTYTVKEKKAPPGFVLDPTVHKLTVGNANGSLALEDDPAKVRLKIVKKDSKNKTNTVQGNASLAGAEYKVTYLENGKEKAQVKSTDSKGQIVFSKLPLGPIKVQEIKSPPGYKLDTRIHRYTVTADMVIAAVFELEPEDFTEQVYLNKIKIFKTAQQPDGSAVAEKGAKFEVFLKSAGSYSAAKETERDILITSASGYATTKLLPYGTYRIHQIEGSIGRDFALDTDIKITQDVSVQAAPFTVNLVNPLQKGNVEITKTSTDGLNISGRTFRLTGTGTAGFPMDMTATTDNSGKAVFTGVMVGTYTVEETNCPAGYDKPANQTVTVTSKGTIKKSFSNVAQEGTVNLVKTSTDGKYLSGINFSLIGTSTTGKKVSLTATTDSTGRASFGKVPVGSYVVSELNCPVRYTKPADQNVVATKNNTVEVRFHNKLKEAQIKLVKKCTYSGGYLSGAVFRLFKSDGTDTGITITSDAAKWVYSPKVTIGDYYLLEEKAPEHYEMNPKRYNITLDETHEAKGLAVTAYDIPLSDVYPEYVVPNSDYRSGTEVIVSYRIHNNSIAEHGPDRPLKVRLTAVSKDAGGREITVLDKQTTVIVPYFAQNLVFWKVKIPEDSVSLKLVCTVDTPEGVVEMDESNNTEVRERIVKVVEKSETPDTVFENTPASFRKPSSSFPVPTGGAAVTPSGAWQQWVWENSGFALKSYGVTLQSQTELSPDSAAFSAKEQDDGWVLKSGYGVSFKANSKAVRYGDKLPATEDMLVLPQHGNLYVPEFQYAYVKDKYRTLVLTASDKLVLGKNSNTITADGNTENRRIHFVPLWYPDGDYTVKTYLYDCWSPAGMLNQAITVKPVQIDGNAYGDWHINNKDKP